MKLQNFKAKVSRHSLLTNKYQYIHLELVKPRRLHFQAGQYIMLKIPGLESPRQYSITSPPSMNHAIELLIDISPNGKGSNFLASLSPGDEVEFKAPAGQFILKDDNQTKQELWFIASGSGIAPLRSMILYLLIEKKDIRPIWLHWSLQKPNDIFWFDDFARLSEEHTNFTFDFTLTKPPKEWELCSGRVHECVISHHKKFSSQTSIYLCGNKNMIEETKSKLIQQGISSDNIHHEQFY